MKPDFLTKETILDLGVKDRKFPEFRVGDTIQVAQKIKEGDKQRIQMFKGDVISFHKNGISTTFIVRRIGADNVGVEKIFPYYSPMIDSIKVIKKGDVRRAKLYYIRKRVGKSAKIKEKVVNKEQMLAQEKKKQEKMSNLNAVLEPEAGLPTADQEKKRSES